MLDFNSMPPEVDLLPKDLRDYAILLAQDGLIDDWCEVFDALNDCAIQLDEDERLS